MSPVSSRLGSTSTSRSLIDQVRARDADAWRRLVDLYAPLVLYWCRTHGLHRSAALNEDDLHDVFQEVFRSLSQKLDQFRTDRERDSFRGWLRTITRNKLIDAARAQEKQPRGRGGSTFQQRLASEPLPALEPDSNDEADIGEERVLAASLQSTLDEIRGQFRSATWQAFWRTAVDGLSAPDAAAELGMTPGAVRVAKSRVLHRLRLALGDRDQ